jgi:CubicO group peptidase (beta-lactamase class C family)
MRTSKPFTSLLLLLDASVSTSRVRHRRLSQATVVLFVLLLTGLSGMKVAWSKTVFPAASWEQLSPEQVGMDDTVLRQFTDKIGGAGVVIREGYLIASWGGNTHGEWASATKPVYSTLMGFAIEEGKMHSPDDRLGSFVKRATGRKLLSDDYSMTFAHVANMISGYARGEGPGERWAYNDYGIRLYQIALFDGVFKTSYTDTSDVEELFTDRLGALQFQDGRLLTHKRGPRMNMTPRDFARLGWFWLNRGNWAGRQLLPESFFDQFVKVTVPGNMQRSSSSRADYLHVGTAGGGSDQSADGPGVYGYGWWFNSKKGESSDRLMPALPSDAYKADGHFGKEVLLIIPSQQIVVAARGNWGGLSLRHSHLLMEAVLRPPRMAGDLSRHLVAYWTFDEGAGEVVEDMSGNGFTGIVNGAEWVQGQQGSALYFNAVGDEVVILDTFAPPLQGTVALWMKPELRGTLMRVLGGSDSFEILVNHFDRIVNQLFAASQRGLESEAPLTDDTWRHVAVTYDYVAGQQQIYLDGELAGSHPALANADPVSFRLTLGNRTGRHEHFRGVLDDIRMYDSVLSDQGIAELVSGTALTD